ncbi:efflux RND transporter periplasmic adaptor subunit [Methylocapsa sp. S129]|uniref:efflux RND transporter periplasmic adaptor subunit n=1 Tax=Methylocapsa sp. S129 TaxID=1641869 RepID=UPI00131E703A|nr:efflux RND transporter periplasmic adaptor subunit [Methylocapsa sp. S129]
MRVWKIVLGAGVVFAAIAVWHVLDRNAKNVVAGAAGAATPSPAMMAMPVPVTKIVKKTLPIYLEYSARTESIGNVTLQAKVSGYLKEQLAPDGADVKQGDLLYKIDPRDFQASLDQSNAQAERDAASLDYLRSNFNRGTELAKTGFLAKDAFDQRGSNMRQAEAALSMDQAAIRGAQLNLGYTEIRAPFAGRLGRNQAPIGTLVGASGTVLNNLVQLDPIYVTFNPSETDLIELQKARAAGKVEADILLPGETQPSQKGELTFIDNMVDRATGTITARATIGNADFHLLPGQYVRIQLHIREQPDALMAPQIALGSSQLGKYVYVVGAGNKVDQRLVSLGRTDGDLVAITGGVAEGDQVIVGNLQKIGPGMPIQPMPSKTETKS